MSEVTPFEALPGLTAIGDEEAGMCVDGVCAVPASEPAEAASQPTKPDAQD